MLHRTLQAREPTLAKLDKLIGRLDMVIQDVLPVTEVIEDDVVVFEDDEDVEREPMQEVDSDASSDEMDDEEMDGLEGLSDPE